MCEEKKLEVGSEWLSRSDRTTRATITVVTSEIIELDMTSPRYHLDEVRRGMVPTIEFHSYFVNPGTAK